MTYNDKEHITIKPRTREMLIPKESKMIGVVGDNEGERVDIDIPRWYDGIDLGSKDIYIVVSNDEGQSDMVIPDVTRDEEQLHITWVVLSRHVSSEGTVYARIRATDESGFVWQSLDGEYTVHGVNDGPESMPDGQVTAVNQTLLDLEAARGETLNAAADARAAASETAPPVVLTESGTAITVSESAARPLRGIEIYGKTTQDGTPSTDAPAALTSIAESGSVTATAAGRNLAALTPRTETNNGITSSYDAATGTITVTGTATSNAFVSYCLQSPVPAGVPLVIGLGNAATDANMVIRAQSESEGSNTTLLNTLDSANRVVRATLAHRWEFVTIKVLSGATVDMTLRIGVMVGESAADYAYSLPEVPTTAQIAVPDGLCGVPVTSGGNYTDATGQQWTADSIAYDADAGTAKYVQRVARITAESGFTTPYKNAGEAMWRVSPAAVQIPSAGYPAALCSLYTGAGSYAELEGDSGYIGVNRLGELLIRDDALADAAAVTAMLTGGDFELVYPLAEPVESDLDADDLAALAALRSCYPATTAYTDAGAWVQIAYVADTKAYIDAADTALAEETMQLAERVEQIEHEEYELIETITLGDGVSNVTRTGLALKKVRMYIHTTAGTEAVSVAVEVYNDAGLCGYGWLSSLVNTADRYAYYYAESAGETAWVEHTTPTPNAYASNILSRTSYKIDGSTPIKQIVSYVSTGKTFPTGTTIEIWGVRANA